MSPCRRVLPLLEAFVDGELAADQVLEVEQHLVDCELCASRVRLSHGLKLSTRNAVQRAISPSAGFEQRLRAALAAERERESQAREHLHDARGPLPWRTIVPVAAAAAFTLAWAASTNDSRQPGRGASELTASALSGNATATVDQLIEEFVNYHANAPAPDVTDTNLIQKLEPEVGVPVRLPSLQQYGARWEGASVVPVRNQRAASFRYRLDGHRVTLYVYNSARFPLRATLEPRVVRNLPVYVGSRRGYSIAALEKRGVGYAIATDLDDRESAELVASIQAVH
ncbi:MAG TPA: zf-HC2 domain-containing protein [Polyangiaceae bacterium]